MTKPYQVAVFGKRGCDKCAVLNQRLDKLLAKEEWQDFEKKYFDVETEEGIVTFCEAECMNPQRIPAMLVSALNEGSGEYAPVPNLDPDKKDLICKNSRLYQHVGLQTDYSASGGGTITPKMISSVLGEVLK